MSCTDSVRSIVLCVIFGAIMLAAVLPATAAQDLHLTITPISDGNPATDDGGWYNANINTPAFKRQAITTVGQYQFVSYYGTDQKLIVGRRKKTPTGWTDWYLRRTQFTSYNINDGHNTSTIGIDGDGYLHIAWGMHGNPLLYTRSTTSVLNDDAFILTGDTVGNSAAIGSQVPLASSSITYPEFYNIPGSGDLMFMFRTGSSGNGNYQLLRWNNSADTWSAVRASTSGNPPWIAADYAADSLPNVNAYLHHLTFDSTGKMHATWTWRTGSDSPTPFKDYQSNHNIMYACSDDQGLTWRRQDGTIYQRSGVHAIDEDNATPVVYLPEGSSLMNQAAMTVDRNNRPVIATWYAPNAAQDNHLRQYMFVWFDGSQWRQSVITSRNSENNNQRVAESQLGNFRMSRPIVVFDEENRAIVAFSDWQRGGIVTIAYSQAPTRDDWQFIDLPTHNMGGWEPSYDYNRWMNDGVLSLLYQPLGDPANRSVMSVLEWDARAYFIPEPSAILILVVCSLLGNRRR